jgi:hypothetical protein
MRHHTLVMECLDDESLEVATGWNFPNLHPTRTIFNESPVLRNFAVYGTVAFNDLMRYKLPLVLHHLAQDLWYLDADVALFQDPVAFVSAFEEYDLLMQLDEAPPGEQYWCTGCFRFKNTRASRAFLVEVLRYYCTMPAGEYHDQKILNNFLLSPEFEVLRARENFAIAPLDIRLFQNGKNAFHRGWHKTENPVIVHANYKRGERRKINALISCDKWFASAPTPIRPNS